MAEQHLDLETINQAIADRQNVFYWQTDRAVDPEQAGDIWADRHRYFTDDELIERASEIVTPAKVDGIVARKDGAQTDLGNVNSVRSGWLDGGEEIIIRAHPKGVVNGYFFAESLAAQTAKSAGIPSYSTYGIHEKAGPQDFSFQVIEKLEGIAMKKWLEGDSANEGDEHKLVERSGAMMARIHRVPVEGYGPFDNKKAKAGRLIGVHETQSQAVMAGLDFNLEVMVEKQILSQEQAAQAKQLFEERADFLNQADSVLVHNDFADWNVLTDGKDIVGVLDWDEAVAGDFVMDIACWSTFFDPERMAAFLEGYWSEKEKPDDFEERFELYRLRYVLSKMTLRTRRYAWDPSETMKGKIETGSVHLGQSLEYFGIN